MNVELLKSHFDQIVADPGDDTKLKLVAVELGSMMVRREITKIREWRLLAATTVGKLCDVTSTVNVLMSRAAIFGLRTAAGCAEDTIGFDDEHKSDDAIRESQPKWHRIPRQPGLYWFTRGIKSEAIVVSVAGSSEIWCNPVSDPNGCSWLVTPERGFWLFIPDNRETAETETP